MLKTANKGDLVYIPSEVTIYRYFNTARGVQVKDFCKLEEPRHFLVVESTSREKEIGIHWDGSTWYVDRTDIFVEEGALNDTAD